MRVTLTYRISLIKTKHFLTTTATFRAHIGLKTVESLIFDNLQIYMQNTHKDDLIKTNIKQKIQVSYLHPNLIMLFHPVHSASLTLLASHDRVGYETTSCLPISV